MNNLNPGSMSLLNCENNQRERVSRVADPEFNCENNQRERVSRVADTEFNSWCRMS